MMRIGHGQSFGVIGPFFHGAPLNFFTFLVKFGQILDHNTYIMQYVEDRPWQKFWNHRTVCWSNLGTQNFQGGQSPPKFPTYMYFWGGLSSSQYTILSHFWLGQLKPPMLTQCLTDINKKNLKKPK